MAGAGDLTVAHRGHGRRRGRARSVTFDTNAAVPWWAGRAT